MKKKKFIPDPQQMALFPTISGNKINGVDEKELRNPSYVYWGNDSSEIAHGALQEWFYTIDPGLPEFNFERQKRNAIVAEPLSEIAAEKIILPKKVVANFYDKSIKKGIFDKVGVAKFDPIWAFQGVEITYGKIIMLAFQHDYKNISKAPDPEAGLEVMRQYKRAAYGSKYIANWLRASGWDAEPLTGPMSGKITLIPPALAAGFGELGKHGSIINPEFGSSFRLSAVLTDCPLALTYENSHEIDEFCSKCKICETACPTNAIQEEKKMVRGTQKWYVDFDKCLPYFNEHQGCSICISVCPWSRPGIGLSLAKKLRSRAIRLGKSDKISN